MNILTGDNSDIFFGGDVPAAVHGLLHQAVTSSPDDRAPLLWTAQALAPTCLATYYILYKHHAARREFDLAERAAWRGLREAAAAAGLPAEWHAVQPPLPQALSQGGAGRFWLFTLKALAFIHLRSGRPEQAREMLQHLDACAPEAAIGSDVIAALIAAAQPGAEPT